MKKCLIVGGGFAGLAAAVFLSEKNYLVELIEASPKLGGRAYSFKDHKTNSVLDNGQHILMGCYEETLKFLKLINSKESLHYQQSLEVNYIDKKGIHHQLKAPRFFYPINLLVAILNFTALSLKERLSVIKLCLKLFFINPEHIIEKSISEWLDNQGQIENIRKALWEIIAVGALNCSMEDASPKLFAKILKQIFFKGNFSTTIIIPKKGLSEIYCSQAVNFITQNGGVVSTSESVEEIIKNENKVVIVRTNKRTIDKFDFLLITILPHAITKIKGLPDSIKEIASKIKHSSILTFHIWVKDFKLNKPFYGFIDSLVHWVFDHGDYITIVISHAEKIINKDETELFEMVKSDLQKYINLNDENIIDFKMIKEKRATFIPHHRILPKRSSTKTEIINLFLAGDWINTGLPSTIEGAVMSAKMATDSLQKSK